MAIDYNSSTFDDMYAQMKAMLDDNAKRIEKLTGKSLDSVQSESEKQMNQAPKFESDRLAFILGRPAADRTLEDTRFLNQFPEQRREFIMQNGTAEPVDQRFLASTIISEMRALDEASRAVPTAGEQERLAAGIGAWMKGDAVKPGEYDIDAITPGLSADEGSKAAGAILKALRG
jgi:hypothetical protein